MPHVSHAPRAHDLRCAAPAHRRAPPLAWQLFAGVHVAGAGLGNRKLAQQQIFGVVYAHQPELDAVFNFAATVADFLQAAGANDGAAVVVVALDGAQAGDAGLSTVHPVYSLTSENSSLDTAMSMTAI